MTARRRYITTTIPYVNARPHLGFALELVQADTLARHYRLRGERVRLLSGTDDNSLKNVLAAEAAGVDVQSFVDRNADAFAALRGPLSLSFDDFIRTSSDPRHRVGVERLWRQCAASGDLYRKEYEGLYCVGCEQFYTPDELVDGRCGEHGTEPQLVAEENWFFRLSRYADRLHQLISSGELRIEPAARRNEVLALIEGGLHDFSVSRSHNRARGWGIPVPDDPSQVVYVWWDALGNYVTSLGYGTGDSAYDQWWATSERRVHLVGKGVVRFHAVYWPPCCCRPPPAAHRHPGPRLPHRRRPQDQQVGRNQRRPGCAGRDLWHRRGALVAPARCTPSRGRRLHSRPLDRPRGCGFRRRTGQPRPPHRDHGSPLSWRNHPRLCA